MLLKNEIKKGKGLLGERGATLTTGPLYALCEPKPQASSATAPKHFELNCNIDWDF